ncbi:hypothetical protein Sru01_57640 [Sphaerisporangium rufum]|uniref:HTH arsR-type domain-containing protein n=1 Tax=Sphaerisporangium rufum TaxID=1381558 RepID=A0A919RB85_9ACTN|nr:DUF5937 family protein [Sphaerisporangium rufum]GII80782.1 hypothetical protein Sru01_57640 [Sphaerisporangium rufum]
MPTVLAGLAALPAGRFQLIVSPLVELGSALHVLAGPEHHGRARWAAEVRARMSPDLAERTRAWAWATQAIRATPFVRAGTPAAGVLAEQVEWLRRVPARRLARDLLRPVSGVDDPAVARRWARSRGAAVGALVDDLIDRPGEAAARFLDFLRDAGREWFDHEWRAARPPLVARARQIEDTLHRLGPAAALASLGPAVTPRGDGAVIAKVLSKRHDVGRRGLAVAPSTFVHPHVYVADVPGEPVLLIHGIAPDPGPVPPAADVLDRLAVLGNAGRLEVCRAIAGEPRTAGEIAMLWRMDPTQVTRHLRALAAAGLVRTARQGRYVRYVVDLDVVEALGTDLARLLLR